MKAKKIGCASCGRVEQSYIGRGSKKLLWHDVTLTRVGISNLCGECLEDLRACDFCNCGATSESSPTDRVLLEDGCIYTLAKSKISAMVNLQTKQDREDFVRRIGTVYIPFR